MQLRHFLKRVLNVVIQERMSFWAIIAVCHFGKLKWLAWEWLLGRWILILVGKAATSNNGVSCYQASIPPAQALAGPLGPLPPVTPGSRPAACCAHTVPLDRLPAVGFPRLWPRRIQVVILLSAVDGEGRTQKLGMDFVLTPLGW